MSRVQESLGQEAGEPCHDARENYQRNAISDAPLRNHLAQPHQEHGAGGNGEQGGNRGQQSVPGKADIGQYVALLEQHQLAIALRQRDGHGEPVDDAVHLGSPGFSFPRNFLKLREDRGQQLNHDGCGDVGKHPQGDDAHPAQGAAAEQVQKPQKLIVSEEVVKLQLVNTGQRNVGDETVQRQDGEGEENLRPQVREAKCVYRCLQQPGETVPPVSRWPSSGICFPAPTRWPLRWPPEPSG